MFILMLPMYMKDIFMAVSAFINPDLFLTFDVG